MTMEEWALNRALENLHKIPERSREGMRLYLERGIHPGHFLQAVLENNLVMAFGRADEENRRLMFDYANYVYNYVPSIACGSKDIVNEFMANKGLGNKEKA